jgi:hypothetical protein
MLNNVNCQHIDAELDYQKESIENYFLSPAAVRQKN